MAAMTRFDFARQLAERNGWTEPGATNAQVVQALVDNGVTMQGSSFRGDDTITRAEAATMFVRASGGEAEDLNTGLELAVESGIFNSVGDPEASFQESWFGGAASQADAGLVDWSTVRTYEDWEKVVKERFPGWAWALDHPELGPILAEASENEFTSDTLAANIRATEWFTSRTEAERSWDARIADPANAEQIEREIDLKTQEIKDLAGQLGASGFSEEDIRVLAEQTLRQGLTADEVTGALVAGTESYSSGTLAASQGAVRREAANYLVTLDEETQRSLTARLATGELTGEGVTAYIQEVARSQFPQFTEMIDQGISVREYTAPQRQIVANMLGRNPEDIDLTGEFRDVLSIGDGGSVRAMSLSETERYIRGRDDYWRGTAGQDEMYGMVNGLSKALGIRR